MMCLQDHDTDTDRALAYLAHGFGAILERGAVSVVLINLLFFGAFFDTLRIPDRDRNEGCKPQDCICVSLITHRGVICLLV